MSTSRNRSPPATAAVKPTVAVKPTAAVRPTVAVKLMAAALAMELAKREEIAAKGAPRPRVQAEQPVAKAAMAPGPATPAIEAKLEIVAELTVAELIAAKAIAEMQAAIVE